MQRGLGDSVGGGNGGQKDVGPMGCSLWPRMGMA